MASESSVFLKSETLDRPGGVSTASAEGVLCVHDETNRRGQVVQNCVFHPKDALSIKCRTCALSELVVNLLAGETDRFRRCSCSGNPGTDGDIAPGRARREGSEGRPWCVMVIDVRQGFPVPAAKSSCEKLMRSACDLSLDDSPLTAEESPTVVRQQASRTPKLSSPCGRCSFRLHRRLHRRRRHVRLCWLLSGVVFTFQLTNGVPRCRCAAAEKCRRHS